MRTRKVAQRGQPVGSVKQKSNGSKRPILYSKKDHDGAWGPDHGDTTDGEPYLSVPKVQKSRKHKRWHKWPTFRFREKKKKWLVEASKTE